ncbi:thiamine ABC transporter substrate-binding protein [Natranaeroarchaeum aerophilus]|uniref:Thiamine ABC transporter substrate-binding protein n=1 Tax=Natranaeroarchaeum aerophilus TaxID=2917711 RepID=A0AAE3FRK1_9EURY|nr:thiamine ABC transporter substrate-binding protein [Natranaeroarchaeum aerophilus]MCL9813780.1 thiamine ABC transporter substrate-binding protein [Natranaeroarchaeum aerophilus]
MDRRRFIAAIGGTAGAGLAGCISRDDGDDSEPTVDDSSDDTDDAGSENGSAERTLTVATYDSFLDAPSTAPGEWVKSEFESQHENVTIEWKTPESGLNHYIQRFDEDVAFDADIYLGLNVDDLIRADDQLDDSLFQELDRDAVDNAEHVRPDLEFDPHDRVLPFDTGYISMVYDENELSTPETFEQLTQDEFGGTLLAQNAQQSDPGQAFLLWTIHEFGEDGYLEYWRDLQENDVQILGSWWDTYSAYLEEERPMVVSYSTDQVFANRDGNDMSRHQLGFLEDQGYANPEAMAVFAGADEGTNTLAHEFFDFLLSPEAQGQIAKLNVQFPATDNADLDDEYTEFAQEPPETVFFDYEELQGNLDGWVEDWAREIAG